MGVCSQWHEQGTAPQRVARPKRAAPRTKPQSLIPDRARGHGFPRARERAARDPSKSTRPMHPPDEGYQAVTVLWVRRRQLPLLLERALPRRGLCGGRQGLRGVGRRAQSAKGGWIPFVSNAARLKRLRREDWSGVGSQRAAAQLRTGGAELPGGKHSAAKHGVLAQGHRPAGARRAGVGAGVVPAGRMCVVLRPNEAVPVLGPACPRTPQSTPEPQVRHPVKRQV